MLLSSAIGIFRLDTAIAGLEEQAPPVTNEPSIATIAIVTPARTLFAIAYLFQPAAFALRALCDWLCFGLIDNLTVLNGYEPRQHPLENLQGGSIHACR